MINFEKSKKFINFQDIDGYNKQFNLIICPREAGKTAQLEFIKIFKTIINKRGKVLILKRWENDINTENLKKIQDRINRYLPDNEKMTFYNIKGLMNGCATFDIYYKKTLFPGGAFMWLGRIQKLKDTVIEDVKYVLFDEYIVDPKHEKYQVDEFNKIIELYKTIKRYTKKHIKFYFCGNPYSKFNPFCSYFDINDENLKPGKILTGDIWLVWTYQLSKERLEELEKDPLLKYDPDYKNLILYGNFMRDKYGYNNILRKRPQHYKLSYIFYYSNKYYAVFYNPNNEIKYYVERIKEPFKNTKVEIIYMDDIDKRDKNNVCLTRVTLEIFKHLLNCYYHNNTVKFSDLSTLYIFHECFDKINLII